MTVATPFVPPAVSVNGTAVLDDLSQTLQRYVALPSPEVADAITLWIAATHAQTVWEHASRLVIKSPLKRCGKTRLLEVIEGTSHRPRRTSNISPAALIRCIDPDDPPTFLLDEADTIFTKRRGEVSETAETLRGLLNAGHSRGGAYTRWDAQRRQIEDCSAFAMAAIACIGDLPDTIEDRAVVVPMRRRAPGETVAQYRRKHTEPELHTLRDRLSEWVSESAPALSTAEPVLPAEDRAADVWEPLIVIADAAGGGWPCRARAACVGLASASSGDEGNASERLLEDIYGIFCPEGGFEREALTSGELLEALKAIEDAPWCDWSRGRGLSARGLAQLLSPYGVRPAKWSGGVRGYRRADLLDAWTRYRRVSAQSATSATDTLNTRENAGDPCVADGVADARSPSATGNPPQFQAMEPSVADGAGVADTRLNGVETGAYRGDEVFDAEARNAFAEPVEWEV